MSSNATLSAAADDRKARLAKLKSLKRKQPAEDVNTAMADAAPQEEAKDQPARGATPPTTAVAQLHLSGRNYDPETRGPKLGFEAPPTLDFDKPTLEEQARDLEEESKQQAATDAQDGKGIDLFKLQPKKPNWDLKREYNQRMEVLNVRTENAIARLVRERLAEKKATTTGAKGERAAGENGDAEAEGMLDGAAIVEGIRLREREEEEDVRREKEAEAEEFGTA
ncbi:Pre-mRNA-splicing factor cwf18 [Madurella mycetomatis]|uniref:Pre-mRNA-splicing factor cwf18 n=1 Tax=Madurella mycetomatis TaxID=100816 RepID=A0A175W6Y0_9PEZI|nr:Pre-mRNA-splicing factor cwf18 [Madurella mycetomatis]